MVGDEQAELALALSATRSPTFAVLGITLSERPGTMPVDARARFAIHTRAAGNLRCKLSRFRRTELRVQRARQVQRSERARLRCLERSAGEQVERASRTLGWRRPWIRHRLPGT
jgi:hypothetical protein